MIRVLLLAIILTLLVMGYARYQKMDPAQQRKTLWRLGTGGFLGLLAVLTVTGRMHWIGALLGALLPFIGQAVYKLREHWGPKLAQHTHSSNNHPSLQEALDVLGLKGNLSKGDITEAMVNDAHRRLIQKLHPDRGGNDYLASKINRARDQLLAVIAPK